MRVKLSMRFVVSLGVVCSVTFAQVPAGMLVVSASAGSGLTAPPTTGLYLVDPLAATATPINGTDPETAGFVAGVQTANSGANAVAIDPVTGHLIVGTIASAAGLPYSVRGIVLDSSGTNALSDLPIATLTATGSVAGIQALSILPNGDILTAESVLGTPVGTVGVFQYNRSTGASTQWNIVGGPPITEGVNGMYFDPSDYGGNGGVILGFIGAGNIINDIYSIPAGGGPATLLATYDNSTLFTGGSGIPTGVTLGTDGAIAITHNNAITGTSTIDRTTHAVTLLAVNAFTTGQNALATDVIGDGYFTVGNVTSAVATTAREIRKIVNGVGTVIVQLPGGNSNGVAHASGGAIYGKACTSGAAPSIHIGMLSTANLGNGAFGLRVTQATPNGTGFLTVGTSRIYVDLGGVGLGGCGLLDSADLILASIPFDTSGSFTLPIPLPIGPFYGLKVYAQAADASAGISTSPGLEITLF